MVRFRIGAGIDAMPDYVVDRNAGCCELLPRSVDIHVSAVADEKPLVDVEKGDALRHAGKDDLEMRLLARQFRDKTLERRALSCRRIRIEPGHPHPPHTVLDLGPNPIIRG